MRHAAAGWLGESNRGNELRLKQCSEILIYIKQIAEMDNHKYAVTTILQAEITVSESKDIDLQYRSSDSLTATNGRFEEREKASVVSRSEE